ncbi:MAG: crossover junction endodeoxyribonuclease RuvC [Spirochaetales bacterium]|nr:crossover junction endodeoxyribonuclease RuvC [Spirochaetales bacterium]
MIRVLGFDPGLANTGWGIIDADTSRLVPVAYGSISTPAGLPSGERLNMIYEKSVELIKKFNPRLAGIENLFFAKNVTSALPVAQAKGVLLLSLYRNGIEANEYTPMQIKQNITGNGRADKNQVQELIKLLLGLKEIPKPDHAADALGAAVCCYNSHIIQERGVRQSV